MTPTGAHSGGTGLVAAVSSVLLNNLPAASQRPIWPRFGSGTCRRERRAFVGQPPASFPGATAVVADPCVVVPPWRAAKWCAYARLRSPACLREV